MIVTVPVTIRISKDQITGDKKWYQLDELVTSYEAETIIMHNFPIPFVKSQQRIRSKKYKLLSRVGL